MDKIKKAYKIVLSYLFVAASVILVTYNLLNIYHALKGKAWNDVQEKHEANTEVLARYCNELFEARINAMGMLASHLGSLPNYKNSMISDAVRQHKSMFDSISLIDLEGNVLYGPELSGNYLLSQSYEQAVKGKTLLDGNSYLTEEKGTELRFYAPVKRDGKIKQMVVGCLLENTISAQLALLNSNYGGCVFLVGEHGKYVSAGASYQMLFGERESNFYSFLQECDMSLPGSEEILRSDDMRRRMLAGKKQTVDLKYRKKDCIASFVPLDYNSWYLVSAIDGENVHMTDSLLTAKSISWLKVMTFDLLFVFLLLAYLVGREGLERRAVKRYHAVAETEQSLYFEYDFNPKCVEVFCNSCVSLQHCPKIFLGEAVYDVYDYVHEDDRGIRSSLHDFFSSAKSDFSSEIRIKNGEGNYEWHKITGKKALDKNGEIKTFIGKIMNVSQEVSQSKELENRAENDLLTGVLNKKTMEAKISALLEQKKENRHYIFYMVDLDNFKSVNDVLGHIYGDTAITDTAKKLSEIFTHNALVGRLGGDEFAVCAIYDAFDEQSLYDYVKKKAEQICEINRRAYSDGVNEVKITSSVGIAVAPELGNNFQAIYERADKALYKSKGTGKDRYTIYEKV